MLETNLLLASTTFPAEKEAGTKSSLLSWLSSKTSGWVGSTTRFHQLYSPLNGGRWDEINVYNYRFLPTLFIDGRNIDQPGSCLQIEWPLDAACWYQTGLHLDFGNRFSEVQSQHQSHPSSSQHKGSCSSYPSPQQPWGCLGPWLFRLLDDDFSSPCHCARFQLSLRSRLR